MPLEELYRKTIQFREQVTKWAAFISAATLIISLLARFVNWGQSGPFQVVLDNQESIWFTAATILLITLSVWTLNLNRRFVYRFSDDFNGNLRANWDFKGPWRIAEDGTLLVTGSDAGGITKVGAQWENYTFTFRARIRNKCSGVVVRAVDLDNYYMFQIRKDKIRPHRRVSVPVLEDKQFIQAGENQSPPQADADEELADTPRFHPVNFITAWQIFESLFTPVDSDLDGWFTVKVIVRGESVRLYIDDELQFQQDSFLKIPTGKVGFRNSIDEVALVRNVQVTVQP